jgi:hypothetical protein
MYTKKLISAAMMTGTLVLSGVAGAATVTLDPQNNGIDPLVGPFQTTGGTLQLGTPTAPSTLTIAGNSGVQGFTESGTIYINTFTNGSSTTVGAGNYSIFGTYTLSGVGDWVLPTQFTASQTGLIFNLSLSAVTSTSAVVPLGTASLVGDPTNFAFALLGGLPTDGTSGPANTDFAAVLGFNPDPGTTGPTGFFQLPVPFDIDINVGSLGGNTGNTLYSVSSTGVVTVVTPTAGESPSTGNFTFTPLAVPEPDALSLAGIALVGLAVVSRRKGKGAKKT